MIRFAYGFDRRRAVSADYIARHGSARVIRLGDAGAVPLSYDPDHTPLPRTITREIRRSS